MQSNLTQHFIRFGLIFGLIQVILSVLFYVAGIDFFASNMFLISILMLALGIGITIASIIRFRKSNGGYMTFKEGFAVTFFTLAIAGLLTTAFGIVMYNVVDTEYPKLIAEKTMEKTTEMMQKFGASEEDIEKALERNSDMTERFTVGGQIQGYLYGLIAYAIYSVILGAIFKRSKPPFEQQPAS
jgi:hypothetical protein